MDITTGNIRVSVANGMDGLMTALMIRSAVFVGEQGCTIGEEADGNDFTATHLLAYVGNEPAGTMRIRYFGGFAKPERLAILNAFRTRRFGAMGVAHALGSYAFLYCRAKGYTRFYGHAKEGLEKFWAKFAADGHFEPTGDPTFEANGSRCVPMIGEVPPLPGAVLDPKDHVALAGPESALLGGIVIKARERA